MPKKFYTTVATWKIWLSITLAWTDLIDPLLSLCFSSEACPVKKVSYCLWMLSWFICTLPAIWWPINCISFTLLCPGLPSCLEKKLFILYIEVTAIVTIFFSFLSTLLKQTAAKCHFYIVSVVVLTTHIACKALLASLPGSPRARTKFMYCKRRKAGWGLRARLKRQCTELILKHIFVKKWLHELSLFPAGMSLLSIRDVTLGRHEKSAGRYVQTHTTLLTWKS